jgi:hypothetical protein
MQKEPAERSSGLPVAPVACLRLLPAARLHPVLANNPANMPMWKSGVDGTVWGCVEARGAPQARLGGTENRDVVSSILTDHPLNSGRDQLGVCGRWRVQEAALQDAAEEVEPCITAVEPVAEFVEAGLQVRGADASEDAESPALEVRGESGILGMWRRLGLEFTAMPDGGTYIKSERAAASIAPLEPQASEPPPVTRL